MASTDATADVAYNDVITSVSISPTTWWKNAKLWWAIIIVLVILVIAVIYFFIMNKNKKTDAAPQSESYRARQPRDDPIADFDLATTVAEITEKQEEVLDKIKAGV